jgi:hypothetical protein
LFRQEYLEGLQVWVLVTDASEVGFAASLKFKREFEHFLANFGLAVGRPAMDVVAVETFIKHKD